MADLNQGASIEAERAEFEAWYLKETGESRAFCLGRNSSGEYAYAEAEGMWMAWEERARRTPAAAAGAGELPPLPNELDLRGTLKEIPLCYPWGTGHKLVREGNSKEWMSVRESTGAAQTLAARNQNIVNSTISAVLQNIAADRAQRKQADEPLTRSIAEALAVRDAEIADLRAQLAAARQVGKHMFDALAAPASAQPADQELKSNPVVGQNSAYLANKTGAQPDQRESAAVPVEVKIERGHVWIVRGNQSFMLAYVPDEGDDPADMEAYASNLRAALSIFTPDVKSVAAAPSTAAQPVAKDEQ
jgi:hypothetical protein